MDLIALVAVVACLFLLIGASEPLASRLRLPFTVVLAVVGMLLGAAALLAPSSGLADWLGPHALAMLDLPIRSNVFLYVFLPTLLFQVAIGLNLRRMLDDWVPILMMAVAAVLVATAFVGLALKPFTTLPLIACLLIGAIVSTTDPSAVVGVFRNIAAPQRLTRIVEGESLLNDAAAIALFAFFLTFVMAGVPDPTLEDALIDFPLLILGGVGVGWAAARVMLSVIARMPGHPTAQVTLSVALPYLTYLAAEQIVGASGVIAVVTAGMTLNLTAPGRLTPIAWTYLREVWDVLAHWAGALIFVFAALLIPRLLGDARLDDLLLVGVVILAATAARAVMLWGMLPFLASVRLSPKVQPAYRLAILWGGLRGAVTLALALAVTESPLVPADIKREVGILATGFTLFTLIVQGSTLRWVIARLGLDRLSPIDAALSDQVVAVALQNVREEVAETARRHELTHDTVRSEAKRFAERLDAAVARAEGAAEILDRDRITLGLVALAGRERDMVLDAFRQQLISSRLAEQMISDVDRLIERTRLGGRLEYRNAGRNAARVGTWHRLAVLMHEHGGVSGPLARRIADRFEILLAQRLVLRDLHGFIDGKIRRIHGRRIAELLHELLTRREEDVDTALEGLHLQFPDYAQEIERRFIRRTALRLEEREYDQIHADGLIGRELHVTLRRRIAAERAAMDRAPALDLAVRKTELIRQFPLFAEMDEAQCRDLARTLTTRYVAPGAVVIRRGDVARKAFFIASGAVELETADRKQRLGRGDMFGELALLTGKRRAAQAVAITHSTLLSLDETRFRRLLRRHDALRAAVEDSARKRGVRLDLDDAA